MNLAVITSCLVLMLYVRPAFGAGAQTQQEQAVQVSTARNSATQPGTPAKAAAEKLKKRSDAVRKPKTEMVSQDNSFGLPLLKNIARDQRAIWTSPSRLRVWDTAWLVPLAGVTAGLMATDRDVSRHLSNSPDTLKRYRRLSDAGALSLVGAAGGLYLWGKVTQDDHKRETGLLSGEALVDSMMLTSALQYSS